MQIKRLEVFDPNLLKDLIKLSQKEGFRFLDRFRTEWENGKNQFDGQGEGIFQLTINGKLVGLVGLNRDPYWQDALIGRLRRLYIHPEYRNKGLGRKLVAFILDFAKAHFQLITLRTDQKVAAQFYLALGFQLSKWSETETHHKWLVQQK